MKVNTKKFNTLRNFLIISLFAALIAAPWHYPVVIRSQAPAPTSSIDYPAIWRDAPKDKLTDSWGNGNRECTSYVAWKIYETLGLQTSAYWGNAKFWADSARRHGVPVDHIPAAHSVIFLPNGPTGHLQWVDEVLPDSIDPTKVVLRVSEYNYDDKGNYRKIVISGDYSTFIHFEKVGNRDIR